MTKEEFVALVKRHQAGDADAIRELRAYADDPRMRREAAKRTTGERSAPKRPHRTPGLLTLPSEGHLNRAAILDVIDGLGIKNAVAIRWVNANELGKPAPGFRRNGTHRLESNGSHTIKLRRGMTVAKANKVLLHEIVHAAQSELYARRWSRAYKSEPHKWEANARGIAQTLLHLNLVTA